MDQPDFERAKQYALEILTQELPATAYYHSIKHTRDDVLPAAERLAALEGIEGEALLCLRTAACYHDLGHVKHYQDHEAYSVSVAVEVLPRFGYRPAHIALISSLIMITKFPPQPSTLLEKIMADADMDSLGREDFLETSLALRREQEARGIIITDTEWYRAQIDFLQGHHYFTEAARSLRDAGKQRNFALMHKLLEEAQQREG